MSENKTLSAPTVGIPKDLVKAFGEGKLQLIKNTIAKGATNDELALFLYTAERTGLDPLTKQIHFVKRDSKQKINGQWVVVPTMTVQTGIDGYRAIAERTGKLAGIEDAVFDSEEEDHPKKATVTITKLIEGNMVKFTASARWTEYAVSYPGFNGGPAKLGAMWAKMPYLMLAKCAEALALRKAFPNDLSGIYTNEEMQQADTHPETPADKPASTKTPVTPVKGTLRPVASAQDAGELDIPIIDDNTPPEDAESEGVSRNQYSAPQGHEFCPQCNGPISPAEVGYSTKKYGKPMCRNCQRDFVNSGLATNG